MAGVWERSEKRSRVNTRPRLLDAAYDAFTEQGFHAATVEDICRRAGFTRGAFYSNFSSLDELFFALWSREADGIVETVRLLTESIRGNPEDLDAHLGALASPGAYDRRWFILNTEFLIHALRNPDVRQRLAEHRAWLRAELAETVVAVLDISRRSVPESIDVETFTRLILAIFEGTQHQSLVEADALGEGVLERAAIRVFLEEVAQPKR